MEPNSLLYRDFPAHVRNSYGEVARIREWSNRHTGLLALAETVLSYLASLCLSDYRTRAEAPSRRVESLLERSRGRNLTFGLLLELLRESVGAVVDPLIPGPESFPSSTLEHVQRFGVAVDALQAAVDGLSVDSLPAALNVGVHVERGLDGGGKELGWWGGWQQLVSYRNRVAHPGQHRWPVHSNGYWDLMGPLLHEALVELLVHSEISEPILTHPVVNVTRISSDEDGKVSHSVYGEERGIWFERTIVAPEPVTERWTEPHWKATEASAFILEPDADTYAIRSPFWDLRNGLPPAIDLEPAPGRAESAKTGTGVGNGVRRVAEMEGRGTAPGTCGEFAQGILTDGTAFHVTCQINKSSTVVVKLRGSRELSLVGLDVRQRKLALAVDYTLAHLDLGPMEVTVRHWSDLDVGKGMGSSTADVLAGIRAIADASGHELDVATEGLLTSKVESSDGSMYPGIAAVNHKTCELVRNWEWFPEFVIVMLVPNDSVDTDSIQFSGQETLASDYEIILWEMDDAIRRRSIADFSVQSTKSAILNDRFLLNPYSRNLSERLDDFGALGVNVGHTGTVCGLLFPNTDEGRMKASEACFEARRQFPDLKDVKVVTTPYCGPTA
jgi:L-threonine kinase